MFPRALGLAFAFTNLLPALNIRSYTSSTHDRFLNFPTAPVENPQFLYEGVELSGIGWYIAPTNTNTERRRQLTMVSPMHFIFANHFRPSTAGSVSFLSSHGTVKTFAIGQLITIPNSDGDASDLLLGTLETEIQPSDGILFQPFLSVPDAAYIGQELIVVGHQRPGTPVPRAGRATLQTRNEFGQGTAVGGNTNINRTETFSWVYEENSLLFTGDPDDAYTEGGDSGSPTLVNVNGVGAVVGVHTAVGSANILVSNQFISYDTFVPFYVDELNERMAVHGYHMTRAVPGPTQPSANLTLTPTQDGPVRAGYPTTLAFAIQNTDTTENANNLKLSWTLPASSNPSSMGTDWVSDVSGGELAARKGGLSAGSMTNLTVGFTPTQPGAFAADATYSADEFDETQVTVSFDVIESFLSWGADLTDSSPTGDDDGDNLPNLYEYAFGGDPMVSSQFQPGTGEPLALVVSQTDSEIAVEFLQRSDREDRALVYELQSSPTLTEGSWTTVASEPVSETALGQAPSFEKARYEFSSAAAGEFFRVKVSLSE